VLCYSVSQQDPSSNHAVSKEVYEHMNYDISVVVARLVLLLRDPDSYKWCLASGEAEAQGLLDLLQDVSTSLFVLRLVSSEQGTVARSRLVFDR
jgi:hypothetical protein